jgi:hypothetical protein
MAAELLGSISADPGLGDWQGRVFRQLSLDT